MGDLEDSIHYFGLIQRCNKSWSEAFMALQNGCSVKLGRGMFQNIKTSTRETTFEKLLGTGKGRHRGLSFNGADPQHKSLTSPLKLKSAILFLSFFGMQNLGFLSGISIPDASASQACVDPLHLTVTIPGASYVTAVKKFSLSWINITEIFQNVPRIPTQIILTTRKHFFLK